MTVSMLLHSMISIRDNVSLGTFHKTLIQQRGSMSDGPNCQPLVSSVSEMSALYDQTIYIKKTCCFVGVTDPALALSGSCNNRSGSDRSFWIQERVIKDNPVPRPGALMASEHSSLAPEYADYLVTSSITNQVFAECFLR